MYWRNSSQTWLSSSLLSFFRSEGELISFNNGPGVMSIHLSLIVKNNIFSPAGGMGRLFNKQNNQPVVQKASDRYAGRWPCWLNFKKLWVSGQPWESQGRGIPFGPLNHRTFGPFISPHIPKAVNHP